MSDAVVLQYVGFETKGVIREYTFTLRGTGGASSEYFVTIANDAFVAHRVRYQDAPDICSLRPSLSRTQNWPITRAPTPRNPSPAPIPTRRTKSLEVARSISVLQA